MQHPMLHKDDDDSNELLSDTSEREHAFTQARILFIGFISYLIAYEAVAISIYIAKR